MKHSLLKKYLLLYNLYGFSSHMHSLYSNSNELSIDLLRIFYIFITYTILASYFCDFSTYSFCIKYTKVGRNFFAPSHNYFLLKINYLYKFSFVLSISCFCTCLACSLWRCAIYSSTPLCSVSSWHPNRIRPSSSSTVLTSLPSKLNRI